MAEDICPECGNTLANNSCPVCGFEKETEKEEPVETQEAE